MANAAPIKICRDCGKDVSAIKRTKDLLGRYQCEPCLKATTSKDVLNPAASSPQVIKPTPPADDTYDLLPVEPVAKPAKQTTVRPAAATTANAGPATTPPAASTSPLPERCPNCDAPVLPNRKLCFKCKRDLTKMDKLLAMKAEAEKGPSKEEAIATWISRGIKWGMITVGLAVAVFLFWGIWTMMHPAGPFDEFPTKGSETVNTFMNDIAKGTPADYDKAFYLVSFRERTTNNVNEIDNYKRLFAKIHDALVKKHGDGWASRMKIERLDPSDAAGEDASYQVTIDGTEYHVTTQVQISLNESIGNKASRTLPSYPENGKNHFGILEVEEFPLETKHKEKPMFYMDK